MKDRILALIAERPNITNAELVAELGGSQSRMSYRLSALKNEGKLVCKFMPHGKKLWRLADVPVKAQLEIQPYVVEKTLHRGKEIPSLFITV